MKKTLVLYNKMSGSGVDAVLMVNFEHGGEAREGLRSLFKKQPRYMSCDSKNGDEQYAHLIEDQRNFSDKKNLHTGEKILYIHVPSLNMLEKMLLPRGPKGRWAYHSEIMSMSAEKEPDPLSLLIEN